MSVDPEIPVPPLLYGGIERIAASLITGLQSRGNTVALIAHQASTCEVAVRFPWPATSSRGGANVLANSIAMSKAVREFRPDIVQSFSRLAYLYALLPRKIPKVMSYQRATGGRHIRIAAAASRRSLVFTACSEFIASMGRPSGGRWEVIPNFVDTKFYRFSARVSDDAPLVFLSRIEEIKGVHVAIAIARGAQRRLVIAGNRVERGKADEYWSRHIAPEVDGDAVTYVGPVNDAQKRELLGRAVALLVPIQWDEPFGIVFAEALACGTPVISCPRGALPEIVTDGEVGFLVSSIEEGITAVARLNEISRTACRRRAETCFSDDAVVSQYEALYRRMVAPTA